MSFPFVADTETLLIPQAVQSLMPPGPAFGEQITNTNHD